MKGIHIYLIACTFLLLACNSERKTKEELIQEIQDTEYAFMKRVADNGIADAFIYYAAEDAVIRRGDSLLIGIEALEAHYSKPNDARDVKLIWKPDFIDVSESGDMAYTYGKYTYSFVDTIGEKQEHKGVFHTIWKRQDDGEWKFVFD